MEDLAPFVMIATYLFFILYETLRPARRFPAITWWRLQGVLFFVLMAVVSVGLPFVWGPFLDRHALFHLSSLGTIAVYQLALYWWHRLQHTVPFVWRWTHQIHHSAERIDIWGVALFHPFDLIGYTLLGSLVYGWLLGVSPSAAALAGAWGLFASVFQHANIRTPRWLAAVVQRPEAHSVHHQRGVHAFNYSDLPLWDMVFGTYRNPAVWQAEAGFYDGASKRLGAMLIGRDVSTPESNPMAVRPAPAPGALREAAAG